MWWSEELWRKKNTREGDDFGLSGRARVGWGIINKMIIFKSNHEHTHNFLLLKDENKNVGYTRFEIQGSLSIGLLGNHLTKIDSFKIDANF